MKKLKELRKYLIQLAVGAVCVRVIWGALAPMISPLMYYAIIGAGLVTVIGVTVFRSTKL